MHPHQEKRVTFLDWAVAQRTVCNRILEKINARGGPRMLTPGMRSEEKYPPATGKTPV
jgi:hypothetical protein